MPDNIIKHPLHLFQAYGVELEYMIVDSSSLSVKAIADELFNSFAGEFTSEIEHGPVSLNNELALHVVELKTTDPARALEPLPAIFQNEIDRVVSKLREMDCRLMPTAMHPWMDSISEFRIWPHDDSEIYDALHRIFDCRGHGWANLQSTHLNLPFGSENEFLKLHGAIRLLLPLIPTLSASSPIADGKIKNCKDFRIETYRKNARKIFSVTGHVIPEVCLSYQDYHDHILEPVYRDLEPYDPEGVLRHEWINARGAITRFDRNAIEIRLIDVQESPVMDCAILWILIELLKELCDERWGTLDNYNSLSCERLRLILDVTHVQAEDALIEDTKYLSLLGWTGPATHASAFWEKFVERHPPPAVFASPLETLIKHGTLATRILDRIGNDANHSSLKQTYQDLCTCLESGTTFQA